MLLCGCLSWTHVCGAVCIVEAPGRHWARVPALPRSCSEKERCLVDLDELSSTPQSQIAHLQVASCRNSARMLRTADEVVLDDGCNRPSYGYNTLNSPNDFQLFQANATTECELQTSFWMWMAGRKPLQPTLYPSTVPTLYPHCTPAHSVPRSRLCLGRPATIRLEWVLAGPPRGLEASQNVASPAGP